MSLKIERRGSGFRVRLEGDRRLYVAPDAQGVAQAVLHYYAEPHDEGRCPLCAKLCPSDVVTIGGRAYLTAAGLAKRVRSILDDGDADARGRIEAVLQEVLRRAQ